MEKLQADNCAAYRSLKLTRDANGVLVVEFHSNGGPCMFTAHDHTAFVDALSGLRTIERTRSSS